MQTVARRSFLWTTTAGTAAAITGHLQETCLTLWEKYDEYDPATPFCAWAFTVARFKVLSHVDRTR